MLNLALFLPEAKPTSHGTQRVLVLVLVVVVEEKCDLTKWTFLGVSISLNLAWVVVPILLETLS